MEFVEKETVCLTIPASTKYHLCKEQGLLEHSVNVDETLLLQYADNWSGFAIEEGMQT